MKGKFVNKYKLKGKKPLFTRAELLPINKTDSLDYSTRRKPAKPVVQDEDDEPKTSKPVKRSLPRREPSNRVAKKNQKQ
jgi:hypothetical protein